MTERYIPEGELEYMKKRTKLYGPGGIEATILHRHRMGNIEYVEYQPGNGTRYLVVFTYMFDDVKQTATKRNFRYYSGGGNVVISLVTTPKGKAMTLDFGSDPAISYLMEKLEPIYDGDAIVLRALIHHIFTTTKQPD